MKDIKTKILEKAKKLFNEKGVAYVSIREISREVGISHSNLIYHFKDKNVLLTSLHQQILTSAIQLNQEISTEENILNSLFISTLKGFEIIYDFRFFMIDFNLIMRENKQLHNQIKEIEKLRFKMYEEKISKMIDEDLIRKETYEKEYEHLITLIRVFSDYWVSSSHIYEENPQLSIKKYARLFLTYFYPYLTQKGKKSFDDLLSVFDL
ncbi:MAG: TetR/AcrR family transcriptional regulator [Bacteroidota bacterium]